MAPAPEAKLWVTERRNDVNEPLNVSVTGAYIAPLRLSPDEFYNLNVSGGYYLFNGTSANLELHAAYVNQADYDSALLGGVSLLMRTHFLHGERWSVFFDGGAGISYADHPVPEFGTQFNFITRIGLGGSYELRQGTYLIGGARYFHVSNARLQGVERNPGHDGIQYWAGMMWTW